ncbi:hypothetical protein Hanom_Chr12g01101031 [Helianthus anomalus]
MMPHFVQILLKMQLKSRDLPTASPFGFLFNEPGGLPLPFFTEANPSSIGTELTGAAEIGGTVAAKRACCCSSKPPFKETATTLPAATFPATATLTAGGDTDPLGPYFLGLPRLFTIVSPPPYSLILILWCNPTPPPPPVTSVATLYPPPGYGKRAPLTGG